MISIEATQTCSVVTLTASSSGTVQPALANAPFKNLTIMVVPVADAIAHQVDVLYSNDVVQTNNYAAPSTREVTVHTSVDTVFPANVGTDAAPRGPMLPGIPITVRITNNDAATQSFEVYACFEQISGCQFRRVEQE